MKKPFISYIIGWAAVLGLFNIITFVTPSKVNGVSKFDALFWVAYALITLAFIGQLACAYFIFQSKSLQKAFYNISLVKISIGALVAMLIVGTVCMSVIQIPDWIGIILCAIVVTVSIVSVSKATVAIGAVTEIDQKIKTKTMFIRMLTADAQALRTRASGDELVALAGKVYEAIRYSDPMSDPVLAPVEEKISTEFSCFSAAVSGGSQETAKTSADELLALIAERNAKCKMLK